MPDRHNEYELDESGLINIVSKYEDMIQNHTLVYFDTDDLLDIIEFYTQTLQTQKARNAIEFALYLHPDYVDFIIYKIRFLYDDNQKKEAYQLLNQIKHYQSNEVKFLIAELCLNEGKSQEAFEIFEEISIMEDDPMEIWMDITLCYIDKGDKDAFLWIQKMMNKGYTLDNSQEFRDIWCEYHSAFDMYEEIVPALKKSLDENPYSITHWNALTRCYLYLELIELAFDAVEFSLAIDDKNLEAMDLKAKCHLMNENFDEAFRIYQSILSQCKPFQRGNALMNLANTCYFSQDYTSCIDYCNQTIEESTVLQKNARLLKACAYMELDDKQNFYECMKDSICYHKHEIKKEPKLTQMLNTLMINYSKRYNEPIFEKLIELWNQ